MNEIPPGAVETPRSGLPTGGPYTVAAADFEGDGLAAYRALALQTRTQAINGLSLAEARATMAETIARIGVQVVGAQRWIGPDLRLVVLPEYVLTGFPMGEPAARWRDVAALAPDGPEYAALAALAADTGLFLSGNAYESDPQFPELYFQSSFVFDPRGEAILRYRRLHSMYSPSPYDVWDRYVELYGMEAVLPVARTEIGNLACVASEEILYPELARSLALRGAEVLCHSTSEVTSPALTPKEIGRRARAIENMAYVVSANSGGLHGTGIPGDSTSGGSKVVDFEGRVLAEAAHGESIVGAAELDLTALRRHRARPGMGNLLSRVKPGLWAQEYARHDVERPNGLADRAPDRAWFTRRQQESLGRLQR